MSQLRALLASELQQKIGRNLKVNIFQDVAAIPPGAEWEKQIRDAINGSFFLIPIVTPSLLQSEWCCQEIILFRQREASTLGRTDLIFPIHYLGIDGLDPSQPEDCHNPEVFGFLRSRQWIDFRPLRHKSPESEDVARRIETLADAICFALRESRQTVIAQAHDQAGVDEDRRKRKTDVKSEPMQKRVEADAKRGEEEANKSAADALADETVNEERRRREAAAEQERAKAAQQQAEEQRSNSEAKGRSGEGQRWPAWLDTRSWSYLKIAVGAAILSLIAYFSVSFLNLYGLPLGRTYILSSDWALYAATILLLVAPLTESPKIQRLAVLFVGVYVIETTWAYARGLGAQNVTTFPFLFVFNSATTLVKMLLEWFLIAYATSLKSAFTDRKFLATAAIVSAGFELMTVIVRIASLPLDLFDFVFNLYHFCTSALLFTYGIRKQKSQMR